MAATVIHSTMLNGLRQHIADMTEYGRYKIGDTWHRAEIDSKEVQVNGAVHIAFYVRQQDNEKTPASQFQLCQKGGAVLAERTENVPFTEGMDEFLYRFKLGISIGTQITYKEAEEHGGEL